MCAGFAQLVNPQQRHSEREAHENHGISSPQCHLATAAVLLIFQPMLYLLSAFFYYFLIHAATTPVTSHKLNNLYFFSESEGESHQRQRKDSTLSQVSVLFACYFSKP